MSTIFLGKRTDMAEESVFAPRRKIHDKIERSDITLTKERASMIGKRAGKYITISSSAVMDGEVELYDRLSRALSDAIKDLLQKPSSILVVGLGNSFLSADNLGVSVADKIAPSDKVMTLCPSVFGRTGIESFDIVKGVCEQIKPSAVICVDTLCSASMERLGRAFQLCDSGITPGSGVSNARKTISRETLSAPVISIGLPLVIYASTISGNADESLIVTPKDIDILVRESAEIIANAIGRAIA